MSDQRAMNESDVSRITSEVADALNKLSLAEDASIKDSGEGGEATTATADSSSLVPPGADEAKDSSDKDSDAAPVKGRVFVGGISWRTTDQDLRDYFGKFGVIKDCLVCKDQWTGKSRGFGFISFGDQQVAQALISQTHSIGGRTVQVKTAVPKSNRTPNPEAPTISAERFRTKLFVGGLHRHVTNKEFRSYFETYGRLADAFIMYNMQSKRSRGFGFVTFIDQESALRCLHDRHSIRGKPVEIKMAIPREVIGSQQRGKRKINGRGGRQHYRQNYNHHRQQPPQHLQQQQQQPPQHHGLYNGGFPAQLSTAAPYGHMLPGAPMMTPPPAIPAPTARNEAPAIGTMPLPQNPSTPVYDRWIPPVHGMGVGGTVANMGGDMYSQDVYYGNMGAPPYGMYSYGSYMPMYTPYADAPMDYAPAAAMYDAGAAPVIPPAAPGPNVTAPPPNIAPDANPEGTPSA